MWTVRDKRINGFGRAVFDVYRAGHFVATVEVSGEWSGGLKVLLGAMQPAGKERAWEAIRAFEGVRT